MVSSAFLGPPTACQLWNRQEAVELLADDTHTAGAIWTHDFSIVEGFPNVVNVGFHHQCPGGACGALPAVDALISLMGRSRPYHNMCEPRWLKLSTPMPCHSEQMRTHSPQRMHLFGSRTKAGPLASMDLPLWL